MSNRDTEASNIRNRNRDRVRRLGELGAWLFLCAGMWIYSGKFDILLHNFQLGPVFWPKLIILLIAIFALITFLGDQKQFGRGKKVDSSPKPEYRASFWLNFIKQASILFLPLLYLVILPRAGFFVSTPFFLLFYMYALGIRRWQTLVLTVGIFYSALLLIFAKFLFIPLPLGRWPGFYDVSNYILIILR